VIPPSERPPPIHPRLVPAARWPGWPAWAILVVSAWALLGALAVGLASHAGYAAPLCTFKRLVGIPCPTCGCGRGALLFLRGQPLEALALNPLLFGVLYSLAAATLARMLSGRRLTLQWGRTSRAWLVGTLAVALAANWAYLVVRGV
jgi:hypothetical protein